MSSQIIYLTTLLIPFKHHKKSICLDMVVLMIA